MATAVLGLGITALVRSFGGALQGMRQLEERGHLRLRLEDKVEEVWRAGVPGPGEEEGEFEGGARWRAEARPYEGVDGLYLVEVRVFSADGAAEAGGRVVVGGR